MPPIRVLALKLSYMNHDGSFRQMHCVLLDITRQKISEDALQESEKKYRTLFTTMETGVFYQRADSRLIDCNPATLRLFGLTREEFLNLTPRDPRWQVIR
ncbi:MAG: PAS domain-containing protein [Methanobacteriota archaeon]